MISSFSGFMLFGALSIMLLVGVLLRAKIGFLQKLMIPASLLGGAIGFVLVNLGWLKFPAPDGVWVTITAQDYLPFTFHAFNISFISLCLTKSDEIIKRSKVFKGGMWLSMIWTASLTLQALVGAGTVYLYDLATGSDVSVFLGYLVTHGFTQGPGQGIAMGTAWAKGFNVPDAVTMGLIWGTMGFIMAYVVGVPYARHFVNKGLNVNKKSRIDTEFLSGVLDRNSRVSTGRETMHSSNIDTLAFHFALIGLVYVITYAEISITSKIFKHMIFSFPLFFLHGLIWALILRKAMDKIGIGFVTDSGVQKKITGLSVDYLLVSSMMGISMTVVNKYLAVIILVSITVTIATYFLIELFRRRLTELGPERAVSVFGCCLGSTASGLVLLRMLDADFSTSVGLELAFFNVAIIFTTLPILSLMAPQLPGYSHLLIIGAYLLNTVVCGVIIHLLGRGGAEKAAA